MLLFVVVVLRNEW